LKKVESGKWREDSLDVKKEDRGQRREERGERREERGQSIGSVYTFASSVKIRVIFFTP
jgi:hypothetical protein